MECQPQNPEFRINPENFQPCKNRLRELSQYMRFCYLSNRTSVKVLMGLRIREDSSEP